MRTFRISSLLRLAEIGGALTLHTALLVWRLAWRGRASAASTAGEELARLCERLGPTFLKMGQILSARPDLLPPDFAAPLARLQDAVPPFDPRRGPPLLEESFGRPLDRIFLAFDPEPVASASVGQVHRAQLLDGREVAVKIRRPGIVRRVEDDLALVRFVARHVGRLPFLRAVPLPELVEELAEPIRQQLDFEREAVSLKRLHANFANVENITLPCPVTGLCTGSVLTMEFLGGLEKVNSPRFTTEERRTAALAGLRALYKMIFLDGFIHADLHPGNIFLRPWGEVVLLDAGLTAELNETDLRDFVDFFFGLVNNRGAECARILWDTASWRSPNQDRAAFERAIVELVGRHSALRSRDFEVTRFVVQLIETQRRFGVRGSTKFIMAVLSMVVYDGICKQLYPECDFQREARGYLIAARYGRRRAAVL